MRAHFYPFPDYSLCPISFIGIANRSLLKVYVLKENMKQFWDFRYPKAAKRFWKDW
jgi:hypothetical protein